MEEKAAPARTPPRHRGGRPVLTREAVGRAALDVMSRTGSHHDATMRAVATELGVTAKALYRLVEDRRDLLRAAANLAQSEWPLADPDAVSWEAEIRRHLVAIRAWYRRYPELLDVIRTYDMTDDVHQSSLLGIELPYRLLQRADIPLEDIAATWAACLLTVFGFTQFQDAMVDRPTQNADNASKELAEKVMTSHSELATPAMDAVLAATTIFDNDEVFQHVLDTVLLGVRARAAPADGPTP